MTTARGEVLYDAANDTTRAKRVWTPQVAFLGLDMIRGVVNDLNERQGGLATRAKFGEWPVAGKTGTSNGPKDFWFVGTTPLYTGAVWVGKQQGGEMPTYYYSGYVNAPIWRRMMEIAHAGKTPTAFLEPPGITYAEAPDSGYLPGVKIAQIDPQYNTSTTAIERDAPPPTVYREATWQPTEDPRTTVINVDRTTGRLATEFTPPTASSSAGCTSRSCPPTPPTPTPSPCATRNPTPRP